MRKSPRIASSFSAKRAVHSEDEHRMEEPTKKKSRKSVTVEGREARENQRGE
jgi:hypothetical protein